MRKITWKSSAAFCVALIAALSVIGCDERNSTDAQCRSTVDSYTSPATGVLTLQGHFYANESILIRNVQGNALVASGTPASDRTSFTFTNIPSGTHGYDIIASCDAGQETVTSGVYDVQ